MNNLLSLTKQRFENACGKWSLDGNETMIKSENLHLTRRFLEAEFIYLSNKLTVKEIQKLFWVTLLNMYFNSVNNSILNILYYLSRAVIIRCVEYLHSTFG